MALITKFLLHSGMDFFPGTSLLPTDAVVRIDVDRNPLDAEKCFIGCHIGNVFYSNKFQTNLRDARGFRGFFLEVSEASSSAQSTTECRKVCNVFTSTSKRVLDRTCRKRSFATVVFNKRTKELSVFHKKPEFLSPCFEDDTKPDGGIPNNVDRAALTNAFGSAKRQRLLRERERNANERSAVANAAVINRAMHGQNLIKTESEEANNIKNEDDSKTQTVTNETEKGSQLLPFINANATCPQDVFPYDKIVPRRVLDALAVEAETLASVERNSIDILPNKEVYPQCVLERLQNLSFLNSLKCGDKVGERSKNFTTLALISHMMALYTMNSRDLQRKQPLPDSPVNVSRYLIAEFTAMINRNGVGRLKCRTVSPTLRDKLIHYILILLLHCDNFKVAVDDLTVDFKLSVERLKRYFSYLGCKFIKEDKKQADGHSKTYALLKTPVRFPFQSNKN